MAGAGAVLPRGAVGIGGAESKLLYGARIYNQGTVTFSGGRSPWGGNTIISNGGLWQVTGDRNLGTGWA